MEIVLFTNMTDISVHKIAIQYLDISMCLVVQLELDHLSDCDQSRVEEACG